MFATPRTLASLSMRRSPAAALAASPTPWREAALEGFRQRNTALDAIFYDVGNISSAEAALISPWLAREGTLLIVPPSGQGTVRVCADIDDFHRHGGARIRALTVAGVGSSALGSAAFARNVADAFDTPVAAVVSGYGLADLATEAFGGWYWFGGLNTLRHGFEQLDELARDRAYVASGNDRVASLPAASRDTRTVYRLMTDPRFHFRVLTGHSKGNLVISEALFALERRGRPQRTERPWLVTVSAVITMPQRYVGRIIDVIGGIDWFGALNSRPGLGIEIKVPLAWHHTNTELPFHLPVRNVFLDLARTHGITLAD